MGINSAHRDGLGHSGHDTHRCIHTREFHMFLGIPRNSKGIHALPALSRTVQSIWVSTENLLDILLVLHEPFDLAVHVCIPRKCGWA